MKPFVILFLWLSLCEGRTVTFNLSQYDPKNKTTNIQKVFINLTAGVTQIQVTNIPEDIGFFNLQAHSFGYNITLSSSRRLRPETSINGTNIGLDAFGQLDSTFYLITWRPTTVLIVVMIQENGDPVPGGCNLSFETEIAPYQLVSYTDDLIIVQSQAPSAPGTTCESNNITVDLYHLYLHENNYQEAYYFNNLQKFLTVDDIKNYGHKVRTVDGYFKYRKLYSSYRGVGHLFGIIATYQGKSSAYIPAVSYGCDLTNLDTCNGPVTVHWKLICAFLLIFGTFTCFFGHKFFRFTLYVMSFTIGVFVTYVILSFSVSLSVEEKTSTSLIIGLIYGCIWVLVWWKYGIPILSVSSTFLVAGFLIASIIFYAGVADFVIFHNDLNFWLTFCSVIIACATIWTMFTLQGHIFGCSLIGAYACVASLNYYTGGNLQYIIINTYRRIVVKNFNMATIEPPFQVMDISQAVLWIIMTFFGFYYQLKEQRGKPPFPPHRYSNIREGLSETTPLITSSGVIYSDI